MHLDILPILLSMLRGKNIPGSLTIQVLLSILIDGKI